MGLFDRFKPDYKSNDWDTQREAISKLTDQNILMDIANNDKKEVARTRAINTITDPIILMNLIKNANYQDVAINALKRLQELTEKENKRNASSNAKKILESTTNESELEKIVLDSNVDDETRYNAIYKINSESILYNIVVSPDTSLGFKKTAERKINDESLLCNIIVNNYNKDIRKEAISKINSEEALKKLVRDLDKVNDELGSNYKLREPNEDVIRNALENIYDEKFLMKFVDYKYNKYSKSALKNIKNQEYLLKIIEKTDDYGIKAEAVKNIKDEAVLVDLACNCENDRESAKYIQNIVNNVNDDKLLAKIANEGPTNYKPGSNISIATIPVGKITDESVLVTFLDNYNVSGTAIRKIKNQSTLEAIAKGNYNVSLGDRLDAIGKLTNKTVLKDLADNDPYHKEKRMTGYSDHDGAEYDYNGYYPIREAAERRLKSI